VGVSAGGIPRDRGDTFRFIRILMIVTSRNSIAMLQARSKLSMGAHRAGNVIPREISRRDIDFPT